MDTKLESPRPHSTYAIQVGVMRVYVSLARAPDGKPIELWLDLHKEGSTMRAMCDALARCVSRSWQLGATGEEIVRQFSETKFPPNGRCSGHPAVEGSWAHSILDAVARVLDYELAQPYEHRQAVLPAPDTDE